MQGNSCTTEYAIRNDSVADWKNINCVMKAHNRCSKGVRTKVKADLAIGTLTKQSVDYRFFTT